MDTGIGQDKQLLWIVLCMNEIASVLSVSEVCLEEGGMEKCPSRIIYSGTIAARAVWKKGPEDDDRGNKMVHKAMSGGDTKK